MTTVQLNLKNQVSEEELELQVLSVSSPALPAESTGANSSSEIVDGSVAIGAESTTVLNPPNLFRELPADHPQNQSTYEPRPDASVPADPAASKEKFNAHIQYVDNYPTDPDAIPNLLNYANNLSQLVLLEAKMKKELIAKVLESISKSSQRAQSSGTSGLAAQNSGQPKELLHQTVLAFRGEFNVVAKNPSLVSPAVVSAALPTKAKIVDISGGVAAPKTVDAPKKSSMKAAFAVKGVNPHSLASPPRGGQGFKSSIPEPNLPPSGAPVPPNIPGQSDVSQKKELDYLTSIFDYMNAHPDDPVAIQYLIQFIMKETQKYHGKIPDAITKELDAGEAYGAGAVDAIGVGVIQAAEYAFFSGYGSGNGGDAFKAYLEDAIAAISALPENKYTDQMLKSLRGQQGLADIFIADHTAQSDDLGPGIQKGDLIWKFPLGNGKFIIYDWTHPNIHSDPGSSDPYNDQYYISEIINGGDGTGYPSSFETGLDKGIKYLDRNYRLTELDMLLKEFKDPMIAIILFFGTSYNNEFQAQQSGLNETTDILTRMTNAIANRLATLAQDIGQNPDGSPKMTPQQAEDFLNTLLQGTTLMEVQYQLSGISGDWSKNVFQAILGINIGDKDHSGLTIGDLLGSPPPFTPAEEAKLLCNLNPTQPADPTPPGTPSEPSPNQGYQQLVSILQQGGSLITGTSKTVSLQLQASTNISSQLIKSWSTMLQDIEQWIVKIITNFKQSN